MNVGSKMNGSISYRMLDRPVVGPVYFVVRFRASLILPFLLSIVLI
jgi:hypothetical protein